MLTPLRHQDRGAFVQSASAGHAPAYYVKVIVVQALVNIGRQLHQCHGGLLHRAEGGEEHTHTHSAFLKWPILCECSHLFDNRFTRAMKLNPQIYDASIGWMFIKVLYVKSANKPARESFIYSFF